MHDAPQNLTYEDDGTLIPVTLPAEPSGAECLDERIELAMQETGAELTPGNIAVWKKVIHESFCELMPKVELDSVAVADEATMLRLGAAQVFDVITADDASPELAGQRAYLIAHRWKLGKCRTQGDLAKKLGVTPGRVSQIIKKFDFKTKHQKLLNSL